MLPIQVHIVYKKQGLVVEFFDSYIKAFELVNSVNPSDVKKIEIIFNK